MTEAVYSGQSLPGACKLVTSVQTVTITIHKYQLRPEQKSCDCVWYSISVDECC